MTETNHLDTATSQACTRSGALALLISLGLATLIPNWINQDSLSAYAEYFLHRAHLIISFEQLDQNPYWKNYLTKFPSAESEPIEKLLKVVVDVPASGHKSELKTAATSSSTRPQNAPPPPPTGLQLRQGFAQITDIAKLLKRLNDSMLLTRSRGASNSANFGIYRWILKRRALLRRNYPNPTVEQELFSSSALKSDQQRPENYVPSEEDEFLTKYLTLKDVRELANYIPPTFPDNVSITELRSSPVELSAGSLPKNLYWATLSAEVLLALVIAYFGFFMREAITSDAFPAPGTLFSVFFRSLGPRVVFIVAVLAPLVVSAVISFIAREWGIIASSILVLMAGAYVLWIYYFARRQRLTDST